MTLKRSLTVCADPGREIPAAPADRLDRIQVALSSLGDEERRLLRIGFETPLERCREQRRYWEFLAGVFALAAPRDLSWMEPEATPWRTADDR